MKPQAHWADAGATGCSKGWAFLRAAGFAFVCNMEGGFTWCAEGAGGNAPLLRPLFNLHGSIGQIALNLQQKRSFEKQAPGERDESRKLCVTSPRPETKV